MDVYPQSVQCAGRMAAILPQCGTANNTDTVRVVVFRQDNKKTLRTPPEQQWWGGNRCGSKPFIFTHGMDLVVVQYEHVVVLGKTLLQTTPCVFPAAPFCVHIDLRTGRTGAAARKAVQYASGLINSFMLERFYFDPRRCFNFFDVVLVNPTASAMRAASAMSSQYYELWEVKAEFGDGGCLLQFLQSHNTSGELTGLTIELCLMIGPETKNVRSIIR